MNVLQKIDRESIVRVSKDQISSELAGEAAILNLKSGVYYGLDPVGARIWRLIQSPCKISQVIDGILQEYQVTPAQCETDVLQLVQRLSEEGLIELLE